MKSPYSATFLLVTLACTPVSANPFSSAAGHYRIDSASHIGFSIAQVAGPGIKGTIPDISGRFDIDPDQPSRSFVEIKLNPSSVQTGQARVENFLRSSAVFNIAAYPQIMFRSSRITQDGPRSAVIEGVLTARGVSRSETFHATFVEQQKGSVTFHVTGNVPRMPYGMGVGVPLYSNTVTFDIDLKGVR
ncbi:polyisoprenoid-binding protein [Agrobacterium genomosp. 3 str. CIP 111-78]|uniref:Polyisoprenoid-binding protein n=1 Tax=Agrobacterium tumefaciens TaxID=358 RepID=A0AAE6EKS5_AGRTU|nr:MULTISPECIES: YceI family protein [Rhizobium/Agrobacterium group]MCA2371397.1 polyisoprenoid-binding protein [Agrobacterium tomkonis CIP 111-78]MCZ7455830.1 YceI family protein [Rhizobium rhizogenes]QCM00709.1 polyisoprenoid-binding protein [Agrobacterium tumefaciens]